MYNCTPACVLRVGYLVVGVVEDVPSQIASLLRRQWPVLEDPVIKLQTVYVVQTVYDIHFDVFVITLLKG